MCLCLVKVIGEDWVKLMLNFFLFEVLCIDMTKSSLVSDGSMGGTGFIDWGDCTIA